MHDLDNHYWYKNECMALTILIILCLTNDLESKILVKGLTYSASSPRPLDIVVEESLWPKITIAVVKQEKVTHNHLLVSAIQSFEATQGTDA